MSCWKIHTRLATLSIDNKHSKPLYDIAAIIQALQHLCSDHYKYKTHCVDIHQRRPSIRDNFIAQVYISPSTSTDLRPPTSTPIPLVESSSKTSETTHTSHGKGFSGGELAGAVVGSAVGAALLTFLSTLFLVGSRKSSSRHSLYRPPDKEAIFVRNPATVADTSGFSWQAYLPQSKDGSLIRKTIKTLFDQVELPRQSLVVLPEFWKVSDEHGDERERPQLLVSPFVVVIQDCDVKPVPLSRACGNVLPAGRPWWQIVSPSRLRQDLSFGEKS